MRLKIRAGHLAIMNELAIEWFGVVAITLMLSCYALEKRAPIYVAMFAVTCLLSAAYALMLGSYPFVFAEVVWAFTALARYRALIGTSPAN